MSSSDSHTVRSIVLIFLVPVVILVGAIFLFFHQISTTGAYNDVSMPETQANTAPETAAQAPSLASTISLQPSEQALTFLILVTVVCVVVTSVVVVLTQLRSREVQKRIAAAMEEQTQLEIRRQQRRWRRNEVYFSQSRPEPDRIIELDDWLESP